MSDNTKTADAEMVSKVVELAEASKANADEARKAVEALTKTVGEVKSDLARAEESLGQKITEQRQYLEVKHGKSGADDWYNLFGKWLSGAFAHYRTGNVPSELRIEGVEYGKADITTGTSGTSYLVPAILAPEMFASKDIYGTIIPKCFKMTVPGGQQVNINAEATTPLAYWRKTQGAAMSEGTQTWGQSSVTPVLVGSYITAANELLEIPGLGFAQKAAARMLRAIVVKEETSMLQGDSDALGTALDPPSDGILNAASGCSDVDNVAASTIAAHVNWMAACIDEYAPLINPAGVTLIMSPAKVMALAAQTVNATNLPGALTWADPVTGRPGRLMGYEYIPHPGCVISTTHYAIMADLSEVVYANSGKLSVDFNPWGSNFLSNQTDVRVMTHTDWAFPNASNICFADYT